MQLVFLADLLAEYNEYYLRRLIDDFELEIEAEFAEVSGRSKIEVIWEDNKIISERKLYLGLIDIEDISKFRLI